MSGSTPTVKDLYKVITADLTAFLTEKTKEGETIQQYLDRFIRANPNPHPHPHPHTSSGTTTPSSVTSSPASHPTISSTTAGHGSSIHSTIGHGASSGHGTVPGSSLAGASAGQQRHANELWYQSLTNTTILQHSTNLPFAFHRLGQVSSAGASPSTSLPPSIMSSPILPAVVHSHTTLGISGMGPNSTSASGNSLLNSVQQSAVPGSGGSSGPSGNSATSGTFTISSTPANVPLAAQRFSAHLITLYTQHGLGPIPIANVASRMIVYLTSLLSFLTPQLVIADWWDRLIEPALQGEIKLEKDSLKACRDLVVECMVRDPLLDGHGAGTGSLLVAGDEEGQLETELAMVAMPIPQFVLRKYIKAAHKLNHRLSDSDTVDSSSSLASGAQRTGVLKANHAGHGTSSSASSAYFRASSPLRMDSSHSIQQELDKQQKLFSKARAIIRRKKDILVKNLEIILLAYGGGVGRVKDFFSCLYTYFVGARFRAEILGLLCQFIRRQRVHLHQILATPLFDSLLLSLKYDTSPLIVSLGLMTLIMLMPRIPAALNDKLPDLFLILSRIICWPKSKQQLMALANQDGDRVSGRPIQSFDEFEDVGTRISAETTKTLLDTPSAEAAAPESAEGRVETEASASPVGIIEYEDIPLYSHGIRWRRYGPSVPGSTSEGAPDPTAIFSFVYGFFPCNLLKFLHGPRLYLSQLNTPTGSPKQSSSSDAGDPGSPDASILSPTEGSGGFGLSIDEDLLKSRVQTLMKRHSLHPDLLNLTCEQEINNKARWQKLEPMELVAMCVGLDVWSAGGPNGMGPVLRSIEEDSRGGHHGHNGSGQTHMDSDDDEDESPPRTGGSAGTQLHTQFPPNAVPELRLPGFVGAAGGNLSQDSLRPATAQGHPLDRAQGLNRSTDTLGSEESDQTPIEILAQEDFFGPRVVQETLVRPFNSSTTSFAPGNAVDLQSNTSKASRPRTRSKEVRMSQILRNFATLRGLDQDNYLSEAYNRTSNMGIVLRDRRQSNVAGASATAGQALAESDVAVSQGAGIGPRQPFPEDPEMIALLMDWTLEYRKMIVHLERDLLMAKNELNFELFLKQQHIQQISKVHRAHVLDASVEAERQNLYNTCRSLKAQLQETKKLLEKEKQELMQRKNKQTHWDTELKGKVQMFRDERKGLQFEVERLKQEIGETRREQEVQGRLLTEERKGTFQLKNTIEDLSPKLQMMGEYESRIQEMTRQLVLWESEQSKGLELSRQMEAVVGRWQTLELMLAAEKEESRVLRNRVSQQSQVMDDLRIQMGIIMDSAAAGTKSRGGSVGGGSFTVSGVNSPSGTGGSLTPLMEEEGSVSVGGSEQDDQDEGGDDKTLAAPPPPASPAPLLPPAVWATTTLTSATSSPGTALVGMSRTLSQNGIFVDQQRRADAMQEFMMREKELWDEKLVQANHRLSREAIRNQQLEDRILELQSQLENARAIDMRTMHPKSVSSSSQGGNGGGGGGGAGAGGMGHMAHHGHGGEGQGGQGLYSTEADFGGEDGVGSSNGMIGRYSQHRSGETEEEDEEDTMMDPRFQPRPPPTLPPFPAQHPFHVTVPPRTVKTSKSKSKSGRSKWLPTPAILERAHTDRGVSYGIGGSSSAQHLHQQSEGSLLTRQHQQLQQQQQQMLHQPQQHPNHQQRRSADSAGSSSAAARAASGGLFPPVVYTRNMSHRSDATTSSASAMSDDGAGGVSGSGGVGGGSSIMTEESGEGSTTPSSKDGKEGREGKKKNKSERDRERERVRLVSGMGPLVDPSKMYRNVRMY